jgi:serine/threonine protein kinase
LPQNAKTYNVAVKNQKYDNERTVRNLKNEIDLWNYVSLKHEEMPFVALYFGSCDDVASANVGTNIELMESGLVSVEKLVQTTFIDTVNALKITLQILMTLAWLAKEMDITHNDLGTRNVIVTLPMNKDTQGDADRNSFVYNVCGRKYRIDTNNFMIKIIDFGLATHGTAEHADVPYDMMYKMKGIQKPYTMDDLVAGLKR